MTPASRLVPGSPDSHVRNARPTRKGHINFKPFAGETTVTVTKSNWTQGRVYELSKAGMTESLDKLTESLPQR